MRKDFYGFVITFVVKVSSFSSFHMQLSLSRFGKHSLIYFSLIINNSLNNVKNFILQIKGKYNRNFKKDLCN